MTSSALAEQPRADHRHAVRFAGAAFPVCSATINPEKSINIMPKSDHKPALLAIEKVLLLLRSVQTLEGTDKDGVEHLLEMAAENLRTDCV
jgi:hypothetical protein